jgi:hypothetical protein
MLDSTKDLRSKLEFTKESLSTDFNDEELEDTFGEDGDADFA